MIPFPKLGGFKLLDRAINDLSHGDMTALAFGCDIRQRTDLVKRLCDDGLVEIHGDSVTVTESGRYTVLQLWGDASPS